MGFTYMDVGGFLQCECKNNMIIIYRNSGKIIQCKTQLPHIIPKQTNMFVGPNVMFLLKHEGIMYVGRADGSISGYRESDNLLLKISSWTPPESLKLQDIGAYNSSGRTLRAVLDAEDRKTVFISELESEYVFNEPYTKKADIPASIAKAMTKGVGLVIIDSLGQEVKVSAEGQWFIQSSLRCENLYRFL